MASLIHILPFLLFLIAGTGNANILHDSCKLTGVNNDLCVESLSSDPKAATADAHGLAGIALGLTARDTAGVSDRVTKLVEETPMEDSNLLQCLVDCEEEYEDASQQLEQSRVSMDEKEYHEVIMFVEAAMADIKSCQDMCHKLLEKKNVLTGKNKHIRNMCSITLTLTKLLQNKKPSQPGHPHH